MTEELPDTLTYTDDGAITIAEHSTWEEVKGWLRILFSGLFLPMYVMVVAGALLGGILGAYFAGVLWFLLFIWRMGNNRFVHFHLWLDEAIYGTE